MSHTEAELFRLCEITGTAHPDYLPPLTMEQLDEWRLYREQVGYTQAWLTAHAMAWQYNIKRGDADPVEVKDLVLWYDPPIRRPDPQDLIKMIRRAKNERRPKEV